jgi:hypothetical protein
MDAAGAFILVRKGKGHGDKDERFERHHRHQAHGTSRYRTFNGYRGLGHPGFGGGNRNQPDGENPMSCRGSNSTWPSSRSPCAILVWLKAIDGAGQPLDSEQFRSAPKISRPLCGRLRCRKTERTGRSAG